MGNQTTRIKRNYCGHINFLINNMSIKTVRRVVFSIPAIGTSSLIQGRPIKLRLKDDRNIGDSPFASLLGMS